MVIRRALGPGPQVGDTRIDWEAALVQRACSGATRAFERLYREHAGRVYGLCLRMTRDARLAEDCTQEPFINAWRALPRFETRSSLSTWLHRIAVNVSLATRRKASPVAPSLDDEAGTRRARGGAPRTAGGGGTGERRVGEKGGTLGGAGPLKKKN